MSIAPKHAQPGTSTKRPRTSKNAAGGKPPNIPNHFEQSVTQFIRAIESATVVAKAGTETVTVTVKNADCTPHVIEDGGPGPSWNLQSTVHRSGTVVATYWRGVRPSGTASKKPHNRRQRKSVIEQTLREAGLWQEFVNEREELKDSGVPPKEAWDRLSPLFMAKAAGR